MVQTFVVKCSSCHDGDLILDASNKIFCDRCARYASCISCGSKNIAIYKSGSMDLIECKQCKCTYKSPDQKRAKKSLKNTSKVSPDFTGSSYAKGITEYYENGKLHRLNGAAVHNSKTGLSEYWIRGVRYYDIHSFTAAAEKTNATADSAFKPKKADNPVMDKFGNARWYNSQNQLHREDGHAVCYGVGNGEYWINGKKCETKQQYNFYVANLQWFRRLKLQKPILKDGCRIWLNSSGNRHREDGPAVIHQNGKEDYWFHGQPVLKTEIPIVDDMGNRSWYDLRGKLHREKDQPAVISIEGSRFWYCHGVRHRENGPAIIFHDGTKHWYYKGMRHRIGGPAIQCVKGIEYWYLDKKYDFNTYQDKIKLNTSVNSMSKLVSCDLPIVHKNGTAEWRNKKGQTHREDGPAIILINGSKYWYSFDKQHRIGGPAVEYSNGEKEWWFAGIRFENEKDYTEEVKKHSLGSIDKKEQTIIEIDNQGNKYRYQRINGLKVAHSLIDPAVEFKNGTKEWRNNGVLHRVGGPAMDFANGDKEWYQNGKLHRDDGPAKEYKGGRKEWYKNGKLHRENGPAIEYANGTKEYYLNGKSVAEAAFLFDDKKKQIPTSKELLNGLKIDRFTKIKRWYKDGQVHREDGPALINPNGNEEWYFHDKLHRDDGPAFDYISLKKWFKHGTLHREGGPACEWKDGTKYWYLCGVEYKSEKLYYEALKRLGINRYNSTNKSEITGLVVNPTTGDQIWYLKGNHHRIGGPAFVFSNGDEWWYENGVRHRIGGPAVIYGGNHEQWYQYGKLHREDGPAIIRANGDKEWYYEGKRHREDGPAVERANSKNEFWLNGVKQSEFDFPVTDKDGNKVWYNSNLEKHRIGGPAFVASNGSRYWYLNNELHREDGPAIEYSSGFATWHLFGNKYDNQRQFRKALEIYKNRTEVKIQSESDVVIDQKFTNGSKVVTDKSGTKYWYSSDDVLHRSKGPAVEFKNGTKKWFWRGKLHRRNNPAIIYATGGSEWYIHGERHREDGPAIECSNGRRSWYYQGKQCESLKELNEIKKNEELINEASYQVISNGKRWLDKNGKLHRKDGPAIIFDNGNKHWYFHGKLHREDGPAIEETNGCKKWLKYGKLHRSDDLPAIEYDNGDKAWYINGKLNRASGLHTMETSDGRKFYHRNDKLHREDGPAIEFKDGSGEYYLYDNKVSEKVIQEKRKSLVKFTEDDGIKEWRFNGLLHREDGPARIFENGTKEWWFYGEIHRDDGPAIEFADGRQLWYKNGNKVDGPKS